MCKSIFRVWLLAALLTAPWAVHAAGMGKLTVNSALGQPFKAEIDLVAVKKEEIPSLTVHLASRDAFRKADIDYPHFLSTFQISIATRPDGQPYVRIVSPQPVVEPFLSMLIELSWPSGRLLREYTVLLDLSETDVPQPMAPVIQISPTEPAIVESAPVVVEKSESPPPVESSIGDKKPVAQEPVLAGKASGEIDATYGEVRSGDTLTRIARNVSPEGVNLNQMLVALHRANRDAFSGNNINRLKVGKILRVPDSSEIAKISPAEAEMEVKAQVADWNVYRQKLAAAPGIALAAGAQKQTAAGKITTTIEDKATVARGSPKEVLKLSKGEESGAGSKGIGGSQDRIRAMEGDAIAKNKTLSEANERIALLEKNIKEMQRLLELKSSTMAEAQQRVENVRPDVASASIPIAPLQSLPAPAVAAEPEEADASVVPGASLAEATKPVESAKLATVTPVAPPSAPIESSLMDDLMGNIEYVGGVLALLLVGMLGVSMMRRKEQAQSVASMKHDVTELQLQDEALAITTAVLDAVVQADEVDSVAEAGIYLDYGRDVQAEKTLTEALARDPNRPEMLIKLLEVYALRKDKVAFDATARKLQAIAPSGPLWEKAAELEIGIDPEDPVYSGTVTTDIKMARSEVSPVSTLNALQDTKTAATVSAMNFDMGAVVAPVSQAEALMQATEPDSGMKFDSEYGVGSPESAMATNLPPPVDVPATPTQEDLEKPLEIDFDLPVASTSVEASAVEVKLPSTEARPDFSIDFPGISEPTLVPALDFVPSAEFYLTDINLNIDDALPAISKDTELVESAHWHEVATKLDLARAYQEMGDSDCAKEILEEVMREGDARQQESARAMLADL